MLRSIALTIVFVALIAYSIGRPWFALLVWSWVSYMNPHRLAYGFAYYFPYAAISAGVTVLGWYLWETKKWFPFTRETILELLLCVWITVTTLFALDEQLTKAGTSIPWDYWNRAMKVQVMILMTLLIMRTRVHLEALVWVMVISFGFYGVKGGLWSFLTGGHYRVQGPPQTFIGGNNEIALALVMVLPLMRYLQLQSKNPLIRIGFVVAQVLTTFAIIGTYSRAGLLALAVVGFFAWLGSRRKILFGIAAILVVGILIRWMPPEWKDRMRTIDDARQGELDSSATGRLNAWGFAWNLVQAHPFTGGGFRVFVSPVFRDYAPDPDDLHDAHSIYFEVLGEHGFPGFFFFIAIWPCAWLSMRTVMRQTRGDPELQWAGDMMAAMQAGLAGYLTGGAFAGLAFFDLPYQMVAVVVLCKILVSSTLRERTNAQPESFAHAEVALQET